MAKQHANVDIINVNKSGGTVGMSVLAQRLMENNFNVNALRTNDVLRKDEWLKFDEKVIEVARERLVAVNDLMSRGLSYALPNALGVTKIEWEQVSDFGSAEISMGGLTQGQNERITFDLVGMPIPIVHKEFQINIRQLEASRKLGQSLDTTQAMLASRIVSERIEALVFNGSNIAGSSFKIQGLTTATNRTTGSTTVDWNVATGAQIIFDILAMIGDAESNQMFGPFVLYVSKASYTHMGDDYKANSDITILERIKKIPGIAAIIPTSNITDNGVAILVQVTSDVIDMIDGIQPTMVMWESQGGFLINFKVLAIMVPRIKDTMTDQSGIVHYS